MFADGIYYADLGGAENPESTAVTATALHLGRQTIPAWLGKGHI